MIIKYYIFNNDWDYECSNEEIVPNIYNETPLDFGLKINESPPIDLVTSIQKIPNSIPNHHQFLCFDSKIRNVIEKFNNHNFQYIDVNIYDHQKQLIRSDYKILNILKVIDAIDKENSKLVLDDEDIIDIPDLRLNYNKVNNAEIFRLYGYKTLVLIREDIAQEIINTRCTGLKFYQAEGFRT
jgi:hypothetical protein